MEYKSSLTELDRFIGSHVYEDMTSDFEDWLRGAQEKMESEMSIDEVWRCQGRIQVMRDVLLWAENFRDLLEEQANDG